MKTQQKDTKRKEDVDKRAARCVPGRCAFSFIGFFFPSAARLGQTQNILSTQNSPLGPQIILSLAYLLFLFSLPFLFPHPLLPLAWPSLRPAAQGREGYGRRVPSIFSAQRPATKTQIKFVIKIRNKNR